uniref:Uncharacterized protein n=1 Tax=Tanacetum cinerariifolium TaxID=118510 RepID=A0A6L2JKQ3_TANCI|nr:hypothetical protein [Tanacetum cinerariifolium]
MSHDHWRSVRRLGVSIVELRDLEDWGDDDVTLGLLECLCLDNVEKAVRLRLMMKETEVKIAEKNISIRRLTRNGAVWGCVCVVNDGGADLETKGGGCVSVGVGFCFKMPNFLNWFPRVLKDCLLTVFNEEVGGDVAIIGEYRGIACGLRIGMRKREECIRDLKALGDREGVVETVRFMEGLQSDDMDRCNRTLSLLREVEVKTREKFSDNVRLGIEINALYARLTVIVDERVHFVDELDMLAPDCEHDWFAISVPEATKEDMQIATKLNRLREELLVLCEKRRNIAHELRIFRSIVFVSKAAKFVAESARKANDQAAQVRKVETKIEATMNADGVSCMLTPELARAADSNDIRDQLLVLSKREVDEASEKMHDYCRLSDELRDGVRKKDDLSRSFESYRCLISWIGNLLSDLFAEGGYDSVIVAMTELSYFVRCGSEERRGMVDVIVSATVSMTSVGGVLVEECVP